MPYTLQARLVLDDARRAWQLLHDLPHEREDHWRVYWASVLALLRSVGYVLDKVDGKQEARLRKRITELWREWNAPGKHPLFLEFIDKERHMILKEYRIRASYDPVYLVTGKGQKIDVGNGAVLISGRIVEIQEGLFKGQDGIEVALQAIEWLSSVLDDLENERGF